MFQRETLLLIRWKDSSGNITFLFCCQHIDYSGLGWKFYSLLKEFFLPFTSSLYFYVPAILDCYKSSCTGNLRIWMQSSLARKLLAKYLLESIFPCAPDFHLGGQRLFCFVSVFFPVMVIKMNSNREI